METTEKMETKEFEEKDFELKLEIHRTKMRAKMYEVEMLEFETGDKDSVALDFAKAAAGVATQMCENVLMLAKSVPTEGTAREARRVQLATLDFLQEFADGLIERMKAKKAEKGGKA